ncbi:MAG: LysM peptidoglycan-binding domain-containing protein [Proteobacteria bacterium]|nr:LysM peptidoglycan-binding domain-containing protein [Pseudomonadota bacterium]
MKRNITGLKLAVLIFALAWFSTVQAQDVQLRADHPQDYVVVKGDTLWDISGRFLQHPWDWPAIWQANPQIADPHWIYPGDVISLIYVDGQPQLVVNRMQPKIRTDAEPINTIPLDLIDDILLKPRVISAEEFEQLPYIVGNYEDQMNAVTGDKTYARGISGNYGKEYIVVGLSYIYEAKAGKDGNLEWRHQAGTRWNENVPKRDKGFNRKKNLEVLDYEMYEVAKVRVVKSGDPAILEVIGGKRAVKPGDFLLPVDEFIYDNNFYPRTMDQVPAGMHVLSISDKMMNAGHYRVVALSAGSSQGVKAGHVFSVFRPGIEIHDNIKYPKGSRSYAMKGSEGAVTLPDEFVGQLMVFRSFDNISYGLIVGGQHKTVSGGPREIQEGDLLKHGDLRL